MSYSIALERQLSALSLCQKWKSDENTAAQKAYGAAERVALKSAETYYWSDDIARAVQQSSTSLPLDTAISFDRFKPGQARWFYFEKPLTLGSEPVVAILSWFIDERHGLFVASYADRGQSAPAIQLSVLLFQSQPISAIAKASDNQANTVATMEKKGLSLDGVMDRLPAQSESVALAAMFLSALFWIEQTIVSCPEQSADRRIKKQASRLDMASSMIRVVMLRRAVGSSSQGESHREYSCQWVVRGHWRQQYYPSKGERSPKWIMPYVKGPDDMPLKAPSQTIFAVTR